MEKINCTHCKKECDQFEIFNMFGTTFCMHDKKLDDFKLVNGMGTGIDVSTTKGFSKSENEFKEREARKGNTVVKGSDGIVRSLTPQE